MKVDLYIFLLVTIIPSLDGGLVVIPGNKEQRRSLGGNLVLTCLLDGVDPIYNVVNIQWFSSNTGREILDKTVGNEENPFIDKSIEQRSKLYIRKIAEKHQGVYTCLAKLSGNIETVNVTLIVDKGITFSNAPTMQHPKANENAMILCKVTGQPNPDVFWKYRGERLEGGKYSTDLYGLRIRNVSQKDNGLYECCAEIESRGEVECIEINVIVRIPPTIVSFIAKEGIASHEFAIVCNATALPEAKYDFFKDGNLNSLYSTERVMIDRDGGNIFFLPLIQEDKGEYTCKAFNDVGEDSMSRRLTVIVPPKIYVVKNVTQKEGLQTTLVCLTYGDPDPEMTYRKEGLSQDYVMGSNEGGRINLTRPGLGQLDMTINPLKWHDTANYTCKAKNKGGYHEWNGTVIVYYKPRFSADMPKEIYNWAGKTRNLTCMVYSVPKPLVEWYRLGMLLQNNETFRIYYLEENSNLQVTVREVDEYYIYGPYYCIVRNMIGQSRARIDMKKAFLPGRPSKATVIRATPTTLEFRILPPRPGELYGLKLFGYWLQIENRILEFTPDERIIVDYMRPSNTYPVLLRVRTEMGIGDKLEIQATTADISAPYPIILNSHPLSPFPYEYTVTWKRPETGGFPIREYQFRMREVSVKAGTYVVDKELGGWKRRIKNTDLLRPVMFYRMQGLRPSTYYQLQVMALNDVGWSIPNPEFVFKTNEGFFYYDDYEEDSSNKTEALTSLFFVFFFWSIFPFLKLMPS